MEPDAIDQFFLAYPAFTYNRQISSPTEFYHMCDQFGWRKNADGSLPPERDQAWSDFRIAMVLTFNSVFGKDVDDASAWEKICVCLGIEPLPQGLQSLKQKAMQTHVNIADMLDCCRVGKQVEIFPTAQDLKAYTISKGRYFPKEEAYAGGLLKFLLREIHNKFSLDAEEDRLGSDFQSIYEPDGLEAASMILTSIHGVPNIMLRIASTIYGIAGHLEKRSSSIDQSTLSQVQATLDSASASTPPAASIPEILETSTKEAREILQARHIGVPKLQSLGRLPPRFWVAWKQILFKPQYPDQPRHYCRTSLSTPPVLKNAFERSEISPVSAWTPGTLKKLPNRVDQSLREVAGGKRGANTASSPNWKMA